MLKDELNTGAANMENMFGMTLLEKNKIVPIESLKFNRDYQRAMDPSRKEKVKKGIVSCGQFLPDKPVVVNQDNEIVDGQHRVTAAKEIGITRIPVVKYRFSSKKKEAEFFIFTNNYDPRLKPVDYWYAKYLAGDGLAVFLYELNTSENSALQNMIALKGSETNSKWVISSVLGAISVPFNVDSHWEKKVHDYWISALHDMGTKTVMGKINMFVNWYHQIFGYKSDSPWAHRQDVFRAIKTLYINLELMGYAHSKDAVNKMKSFIVDSAFISAPLIGKKMHLVNHYNKNRKKNLLSWEIK